MAAVWSDRQPLAHAGSVLSLFDGPEGCDPGFCVVWFRFRMLRRCLAYRSHEVGRVCRMLALASEGCASGSFSCCWCWYMGFVWDPHIPGWRRPGLPCLSNMAGLTHNF